MPRLKNCLLLPTQGMQPHWPRTIGCRVFSISSIPLAESSMTEKAPVATMAAKKKKDLA